MMKKIPRQLDTSSKKVLERSNAIQSHPNTSIILRPWSSQALMLSLEATVSSSSSCKLDSFLLHRFSALVMNTFWGIIKSVQIILLYPLILVDIPPNVQLLYFFMNQNLNIQILPLDFLIFKFLDFESANSSTAQSLAFNDKFDDQDIF